MRWYGFEDWNARYPEMRALSKADHLKISGYCLRKSFRRGEVRAATVLLATIWIGPFLTLLASLDALEPKLALAFFAQWLIVGNAALIIWIYYRHEVTRAFIPEALQAFRAGELK